MGADACPQAEAGMPPGPGARRRPKRRAARGASAQRAALLPDSTGIEDAFIAILIYLAFVCFSLVNLERTKFSRFC
ncbi:jg24623 [Pararge aegeria aegeria]|uniref:Jg24623 protein n=1 Tax=Pararge aegeria aegeria TaxID=348720 RepID=A0A8S4QL76_9NEOP|nr:jg24623 [Pararge aegeria aegeria]